VLRYNLVGMPQLPLVTGLSGSYGLALDADGNALVTGGFTPDFSSSTLLAVGPLGATAERAHGFAFSSDVFYDAARDAALVLDFGVSEVTAVCADADGDASMRTRHAAPVVCRASRSAGSRAAGDDTLLQGPDDDPQAPALDQSRTARRSRRDAAGRVIADRVAAGRSRQSWTGWATARRDVVDRKTRRASGSTVKVKRVEPPRPAGFAVKGKAATSTRAAPRRLSGCSRSARRAGRSRVLPRTVPPGATRQCR
jgi:hypothetical protein